jgi:hypothetical protein
MTTKQSSRALIGSMLILALALYTGCEVPFEHDRSETAVSAPAALPAMTNDDPAHDAVVLGDDGEITPAAAYGEGVLLSQPGASVDLQPWTYASCSYRTSAKKRKRRSSRVNERLGSTLWPSFAHAGWRTPTMERSL